MNVPLRAVPAVIILQIAAPFAAPPSSAAEIARVFVGTWGPNEELDGHVYRYEGGTTWTDLTPPAGFLDAVWDLEWFEDELWASGHVGVQSDFNPNLPHGTSGHVFRFDGTTWTEVSPPGGFSSAATTVSAFDGQIYVTVDHLGLMRWDGGTVWSLIDEFELAAQALVSDSYENRPMLYMGQDNTDEFWLFDPSGLTACVPPMLFGCQEPPNGLVCSAECHSGSCIHALTEFDDGTGTAVYGGAWRGQIYKFDDATQLFIELDEIPDAVQPDFDLEHVQGLAGFQGELWAGMSDGRLWASPDATAATWSVRQDFGDDQPFSDLLAVPIDDLLWMGYGGVPWRWARRDGVPMVKTWDGTDIVDRSVPGQFPFGILTQLAVVPELSCDAGPDQVAECVDGAATVVLDGSASTVPADALGVPATFTWTGDFVGGVADGVSPEVTFEGIGDHVATLTITAGPQSVECFTTVSVIDVTPPAVEAAGDCIWPPDHRYRCYTAEELLADFDPLMPADACDGMLTVGIVGVSSSQPEDATGDGDGHTQDDMLFDESGVCVRGERQGADPAGRTYTVEIVVADASGNESHVLVGLFVPHDQRPDMRCGPRPPDVGLLPHAELPLGPDPQEGTYPD